MHAARTTIALAILLLATGAFAGNHTRPHASPILSGTNIDLVDVIETGNLSAALVSDPYVYAVFVATLVVIDVSDPGNPVRVGATVLPEGCSDIEKFGTHLYCYGSLSVKIVDVSVPSSPAVVGSFEAVGGSLDIDGNRLYIRNSLANGLQIYDLSNPTSPVLLGTSAFPISTRFEVKNAYVYASASSGLQVINATNPANPVIAGTVPIGTGAHELDVSFPYAYVLSTGGALGLYIINVSNPATPTQVGFYPMPPPIPPDFEYYEDVAVNGNMVYISGGPPPLRRFDVSNPATPIQIQPVNICAGCLDGGIRVDGDLAVINSNLSVCVMDCSNPTTPVPLASYEALPDLTGLALTPTHLVAPFDVRNLVMVDRNDNQQRSFFISGYEFVSSSGVVVKGDYAYVGNWVPMTLTGYLSAFDISDPGSPIEAGQAALPAVNPQSFVAGLSHIYVTDFNNLVSVDISDPAAPDVAGQISTHVIYQLAPAEPYLYAAAFNAGLVVYNASNPAAPTPVGAGLSNAALGGQPYGVAVDGSHAFVGVSGPTGSLKVIDITNPLAPAIVGSLALPSTNAGGPIAVRDTFVYFVSGDKILHVVDVSNPSTPVEAGSILAGSIAGPLSLAPPYIYALGINGPIMKFETDLITDVDSPPGSPFVLGQNYPNPFHPSTRIAFELPTASHASVEIFDVRGGLVRTLADERMSAGLHTVEWNGRDDGGQLLGSGVYFYRLTADGRSQAKKMVILK